jgi:hypothetical protein
MMIGKYKKRPRVNKNDANTRFVLSNLRSRYSYVLVTCNLWKTGR